MAQARLQPHVPHLAKTAGSVLPAPTDGQSDHMSQSLSFRPPCPPLDRGIKKHRGAFRPRVRSLSLRLFCQPGLPARLPPWTHTENAWDHPAHWRRRLTPKDTSTPLRAPSAPVPSKSPGHSPCFAPGNHLQRHAREKTPKFGIRGPAPGVSDGGHNSREYKCHTN